MAVDLSEHYRAVLDDLQKRRDALATELAQLDASVAIIQRQAKSPLAPPPPVAQPVPVSPSSSANYSNMSVRWATLWYLTEGTSAPRKTGEIAQVLRDGGYPTSMGETFRNSVSAVLSAMKSKEEPEVETVEDGAYRITATGRAVLEHIKASERFRLTQRHR